MVDFKAVHAKIRELTLEIDCLVDALSTARLLSTIDDRQRATVERYQDPIAKIDPAYRIPIHRFSGVAPPAGIQWACCLRGKLRQQWEHDRPPACKDADAAHGDRGLMPASGHGQARARPPDLALFAAPIDSREAPTRSGLWTSTTCSWPLVRQRRMAGPGKFQDAAAARIGLVRTGGREVTPRTAPSKLFAL